MEKELESLLEEEGFACVRSPASGKGGKKADGTEREQPDVIAGNGDVFYAFECKSSSDDVIYIKQEEIDDLKYFSMCFGAESKVGIRFNYCDWGFFDPEDMHRTNSGNYRIKKENINKGERISDITC